MTIWFLYNQHLSRHLIDRDLLVSYQSIVNFEEYAIASLSTFISNNIPKINCTEKSLSAILDRNIQPDWARSNGEISQTLLPEIDWGEIADICTKIYKTICDSNFNATNFKSSFSSTPEAILRGCAVLGWQKMPEITKDLTNELQAARLEITQLKNSRSWKLTAPLRWLADKAKR